MLSGNQIGLKEVKYETYEKVKQDEEVKVKIELKLLIRE